MIATHTHTNVKTFKVELAGFGQLRIHKKNSTKMLKSLKYIHILL